MSCSSASSLHLKTLISPSSSFSSPKPSNPAFSQMLPPSTLVSPFRLKPLISRSSLRRPADGPWSRATAGMARAMASGTNSEPRETILLPGCDYNHWLIVMEFPKDPAPTREQMIETYLNTLATVLGSMEEAKKNMYAFSTTTYTGFQCTVSEETSEKFKGLPGVLWVLPDSYIDVKNKDYGGDKYINGEIIPCTYPTYQPKQRNSSKYESRRYERRRDGPPPRRTTPRQAAPRQAATQQAASQPESAS